MCVYVCVCVCVCACMCVCVYVCACGRVSLSCIHVLQFFPMSENKAAATLPHTTCSLVCGEVGSELQLLCLERCGYILEERSK